MAATKAEAEPTSANQTTLNHAMSVWFLPEVERRQAAGLIPKPYEFIAAQVIFYADGRPRRIRLNEEVVAVIDVKYKNGVPDKIGKPVSSDEVERFNSMELPDSEDPNCGHFTAIALRGMWYFAFDCVYNKGRGRELLGIGAEFLESASEALRKNHFRAFGDTLFSAAEIAANVVLLATPRPREKPYPRHGVIHSRFNQFAKLGNVDRDERASFNKLAELRRKARYGTGALRINSAEASKLLNDVRKLFERAEKLVKRRTN